MTSYILGVGCSTAATPAEVATLVRACLREAEIALSDVLALATHSRKAGDPTLPAAALMLGLPLRYLDQTDLSQPGVSEAAAAAAGALVLGKRKSAFATCAVGRCAPGFALSRFGQPAMPSAAIAPSTLSTVWAAP